MTATCQNRYEMDHSRFIQPSTVLLRNQSTHPEIPSDSTACMVLQDQATRLQTLKQSLNTSTAACISEELLTRANCSRNWPHSRLANGLFSALLATCDATSSGYPSWVTMLTQSEGENVADWMPSLADNNTERT